MSKTVSRDSAQWPYTLSSRLTVLSQSRPYWSGTVARGGPNVEETAVDRTLSPSTYSDTSPYSELSINHSLTEIWCVCVRFPFITVVRRLCECVSAPEGDIKITSSNKNYYCIMFHNAVFPCQRILKTITFTDKR
eukprot:sb/3474690/